MAFRVAVLLGFLRLRLRGLLAVCLVLLSLIFGNAYWLALRRGPDSTAAALVTIDGVLLGS